MEYRPIPEDRHDEFQRILQYAFRPQEGPPGSGDADDEQEDGADEPGPGEPRGLFEGDEIRAVCRHHYFDAYVRDEWRPLAGLSAVATPPENRYQGLVGGLLAESLAEYRDRGVHVSALWPFEYRFYAKYGWETLNKFARYECPPDQLAFAREVATGEFRALEPDDWETLADLHRRVCADDRAAFGIDRTERWWRERVFEGWRGRPHVYVFEHDGRPDAYLAYFVEDEDDDAVLGVRDLVAADQEAYLNVLRFLSYHDSQIETVELYGSPDADLLDLVERPREVETSVLTGAMVRLVDVAAALEALTYPVDTAEPIRLRVHDSTADWNDGTLALSVTDGQADCTWVGEGSGDDGDGDGGAAGVDPHVETDVGTLSQVYAGTYAVPEAARLGGLTVHDGAAGDRLTALFPPEPVALREFF